ncbi:group II intron maturase-specific domain-containing protein [uncultured Desulfobacter sp.]|uniref:group II intron maturase-specific domain-containing protein n=1 Tax=uncultured Desulfobacter sp. TaxID=240139 RepID=UPI00338F9F64
MKAEKEKLKGIINHKVSFLPLPKLIERINRQLVGWSIYFRLGYPRSSYRQINWYVYERLTRHLHRRSQRPYRPPQGLSYYRHYRKLGLIYLKLGQDAGPLRVPFDEI